MKKLLVLIMLAACVSQPKPLDEGKCDVIEYKNGIATASWCQYKGYWWFCTENICYRKDPLPAETK